MLRLFREIEMTRNGLSFLIVAGLAGLAFGSIGCDARTPPIMRDGGGDGAVVTTSCFPGGPAFRCEGNLSVACNADGSEGARVNCIDSGQVCVDALGCMTCRPSSFSCQGNDVVRCNTAGTAYEPFMTCDAASGRMCNALVGACTSPCDDAAAANSYEGCDYWPVTTLNSQVDASFIPAVVVANPQTSPVTVTLTRGGSPIDSRTVAPGTVEAINLPWQEELKGTFGEEASVLSRNTSYHLTATLPVTVYQFNPLEYEQAGDFSFSNDASLLLPSHAMTGNYTVLSQPALLLEQEDLFFGDTAQLASPGFFTVTAVGAAPVTVTVQFRARTRASTDGSVRAFSAGETGTFDMNQGDVLQLVGATPTTCNRGGGMDSDGFVATHYCVVPRDFDFTGTEIRATGPIQVISGHNCAFMPFNRWACDHLEEALFPQDAWGTESIVVKTQPPMGRSEPNVVRIVSGADSNSITFDPAVTGGRTLNRGEFMEFEATQSFRVVGTGPIMVGQFLVGQDYAGSGTSGADGQGDPAMSLAIPSEQFRTEYTFLAPSSYPTSYVAVTAASGATVTLDGTPVTGFAPVGSTGFGTTNVMITPGRHAITGSQPFGIVVYGYGTYTSYMYPGGLDLEAINPLI